MAANAATVPCLAFIVLLACGTRDSSVRDAADEEDKLVLLFYSEWHIVPVFMSEQSRYLHSRPPRASFYVTRDRHRYSHDAKLISFKWYQATTFLWPCDTWRMKLQRIRAARTSKDAPQSPLEGTRRSSIELVEMHVVM